MFLELLRKEFIERKTSQQQSKVVTVFSIILKVILLACLIALEVFIVSSLDSKITSYSSYGSFDFLVLIIFVMMLIGIVFTMIKARNVIFNHKDSRVTLPLPIAPSTQISAKIAYVYIESVFMEFFTSTPILITYGVRRHFIPYYHIFSILYPFIISVFIIGIGLLLSLVYQQVYKLIKRNDIAQFVTASILVVVLCYAYKVVLDLFLTALSDSSIGGMFSSSFVSSIHKGRMFMLPVYFLLDSVIEKTNIGSDVLIFVGSSILALVAGVSSVSLIFYHEIKNEDRNEQKIKKKDKALTLVKPFKALILKEINLLFRDENNLFSYTSLLIMCPFLTFVVISSLNSIIYDNLKYYAAYFPELVSGINLTLILLFSGVINASASLAMTREGKGLKIVKTLPISPLKQIFTKTLIPACFSEFSLLITLIVLISARIISVSVFFSAFYIGSVILVFNNIFGVYADMHDMQAERRKIKLSIINEIIPVLLPVLIFVLFFVFSIVIQLPSYALYLIACGFTSLLLTFFIGIKGRYQKAFLRMEVSN